ncbi:glycine cleavage T C-terminal barrel domain-containing protein [Hyphococcus sp.]|uniref:glycine cleavage T C-terminal barrel domain-containing protein n=1 Tax=Hyphococcus sp. TaxID=2038636 RepID=UPI002081CD77|nr:MAG: glycine cleavage system protein T [Marinicaulis sp.]
MIFPAEDFFADAPRPTPLFTAVASHSEANLWTSVNGWTTARVYSSVTQEYESAKSGAALADLGPLARYAVRGDAAAEFLGRLTTAPALTLQVGESARGLMLNDRGYVIDLAEVSRLSDELFLLTLPAPHARHIALAIRGLDVAADDISGDVAALGVFGPQTAGVLAAAGLKAVSETMAASGVLRGVETAARPIQFGALPGVELIFPKDEALTIWERIIRRGAGTPVGLDALEILRLEAGAPRPGLDFTPAGRAGASPRTPEELGLAHLAPLDRGWYNGRRGLRELAGNPRRRLRALSVDAESASPGAAVFCDGKPVGRVTSCAWSPARKRVIVFADVDAITRGNAYEISASAPAEGRVPAKRFETVESALAKAFVNQQGVATDFRR